MWKPYIHRLLFLFFKDMKAFYYKLKKYKNSKLFEKTRWEADAILVLDK